MSLTLIHPDATIQCGPCGVIDPGVPVGVPDGWDGAFRSGVWCFTCPDCLARPIADIAGGMRTAVMATFRPSKGDIALHLEQGRSHASTVLTIDEARAIHGALGRALALAGCAADPLSAVDGRFSATSGMGS